MYILDSGCGWIPDAPVKFMYHIINLIKNLTPVILIIMGSLDFGKAVMSQKEDEIKKAQGAFIKKLIAGAAVFFVVVFAKWVVNILNNAGGNTGNAFQCASLLLNGSYAADDKSYYDGPDVTKKTTKDYNKDEFETCQDCEWYYMAEIAKCANNDNDNIQINYYDECANSYSSPTFYSENYNSGYLLDAATLYLTCAQENNDAGSPNCKTARENYKNVIQKYNLGFDELSIPDIIYLEEDAKYGFTSIPNYDHQGRCSQYAETKQDEYTNGNLYEKIDACTKNYCTMCR